MRSIGTVPAALACAALLIVGAPAPAEEAAPQDARTRCEDTLPRLERAVAADPGDRASARAAAQCQIALRRYEAAYDVLRALHERDPAAGDVDLYLGIASYHVGDLASARAALERARRSAPERAETHLYLGVLDHEAGRLAEAVAALERARSLDLAGVDPMASYYLGAARLRLGDRDAARADLARVAAGQGAWAEKARSALARLDARAPDRRRWRVEVGAGFEVDDNVVLRGDDVALPEEISDDGDERMTWRVMARSDLLRGRRGTFGATADYGGTLHDELHEFDLHYPVAALWWQRRVGPRDALRVEARGGHAWVDGSAFVATWAVGPTVVHAWKRAGRTSLRARAFGFEYRERPDDIPDGGGAPGSACPAATPVGSACGVPGRDEAHTRNRSGVGYELFAGHRWSLPWLDEAIELRPALRFQHYLARGREAAYLRIEPRVGVRVGLPFEVAADLDASFAYRPYQGASSLPAPGSATVGQQFQPLDTRRRDRIWGFGAALERTIARHYVLQGRYTFLDHRSNHAISDYQRHVFGVYLTVELGN